MKTTKRKTEPKKKLPLVEETFFVQCVIIREVEVTARDCLHAEREAYRKLTPSDQASVIAIKVMEDGDSPGALNDHTPHAWHWAKSNMYSIDKEWTKG